MHTQLRALRQVASAVVVLESLSCQPAQSASLPLVAGASASDWAARSLGSPARNAIAMHYGLLPQDWDDYFPHLPSTVEYAMDHASQVDEYQLEGDPDLVVIHDAPPWLDPARAVPPSTSAGLRFVRVLPSGMRLYGSESPFFGAEVAVLAPSTWFVVLNDTTTGRLDLAVAGGDRGVPFLPLRAGAALESWDLPSRFGRWPDFLPARDAIVADGAVVYPAVHGAQVPFVQKYIYRDASTADRAASDLRGLWQNGTLRSSGGSLLEHLSGVQLEGTAVLLQSYLSARESIESL